MLPPGMNQGGYLNSALRMAAQISPGGGRSTNTGRGRGVRAYFKYFRMKLGHVPVHLRVQLVLKLFPGDSDVRTTAESGTAVLSRVPPMQDMSRRPTSLLPRATCPHCWTKFPPEDSLWVSAHPDLDDDDIVTPRGQRRFLPTRLNENGHAIDVKGEICYQLACPRCHLTIVRASLELNPLFFSILGAPGSGKSYYLAASIWQLRKALSSKFCIAFGDADPASNRIINQYEEILFLNNDREAPVALPKTEKEGDLYESVVLAGRPVLFPRPFVFSVKPQPDHPGFSHLNSLARALCLYT